MKKLLNTLLYFALLLLMPLVSKAAFEPDPNSVYKIVNRRTGLALEVGGSDRYAQGKQVNSWSYWGGAHQQWRFRRGSGVYSDRWAIINRNSGQRMSIRNAFTISANWSVEQQYGTDYPFNSWTIGEFLGGVTLVYRFGSTGADRAYLTVGSNGNTYTSEYTSSDIWDVIDVSADQRPVYRLINVLSSKVLSVNLDNGSVNQGTDYGLAGQQWSFSDYNSDGFITVINRSMGQVLEIGGGGDLTLPGRTANLYDYWGGQNQQWQLIDLNTGNPLTPQQIASGQTSTGIPLCYIYNRLSGKILEIGGNGNDLLREGQGANQWYAWGGDNQRWRLELVGQNRGTNPTTNTLASGTALKNKTAEGSTLGTLKLYPNPAHTTLSVALREQGEVSAVHVTDMRGGTTMARHRGNGQVDVSDLAPGLYMVTVSAGQHTYHQKFIKE